MPQYDEPMIYPFERLSDLTNAARDATEVTLLKSKLVCNGFVDITFSDVTDKRGLIGTIIQAEKKSNPTCL